MTSETQNTPRKLYAAPRLLIYGDIREITQNSSGKDKDGSTGKGGDKTG